jgi:hypothetical protein
METPFAQEISDWVVRDAVVSEPLSPVLFP